MSVNSTRSTVANGRLTDTQLYQYCLRVAYLSYLLTPRPRKQEEDSDSESPSTPANSRPESSRLSQLINFADLIPRSEGREVKFPKDFIKAIDERLQRIAIGKDASYTDQYTRRTVAVFWGNFKDPRFVKQMKDNRRIEELILMYVTSSTSILKKDKQLAEGDGWKLELNKQVAIFIRILRETLRGVHHVPPELHSRLDMYANKVALPQEEPSSGPSSAVTRKPPRERDSWVQIQSESSIADMPLVQTVGRLFGIEDAELQKDVNAAVKVCTDKAALVDLKTCLKNITVGMPFPGRREDFQSEAAYNHWKTTENSQLSQLMVAMIRHNPALSKFTPSEISSTVANAAAARPESIYVDSAGGRHDSISSRFSTISIGESDADEPADSFTFIPVNPKKAYKRLVEMCVDADLSAMVTLPEDQEVSLTILSPRNHEVINECAMRWRIPQTYRVACFLDVVRYKYEREEVPLECVPEALQVVNKTIAETALDLWPVPDIDYLSTIYGSLYNILLGMIYHSIRELTKLSPNVIMTFDDIIRMIHGHELLARYEDEIANRLRELSDHVRTTAVHEYTEMSNDVFGLGDPDISFPLLELSTKVEKTAKKLDKQFGEPLTGNIDLVSLVVESQIPLYLGDLEDQRTPLYNATCTANPPTTSIDSVFSLYRRVGSLLKLHAAFCPDSGVAFDLVGYFEPYVHHWIRGTDSKTLQWVQAAIAEDKFVPEGEDRNSSSIVDLFGSLNSPIDFILDLEWPDEYHNARFMTRLASTISQAVEKYCRSIEELFEHDMFPRAAASDLQPQKQSAWLEKAKQYASVGEKKIEVFNFTPEPCVKLNNIEAARKLLDNIQNKMQVDQIVAALEDQPPPPPEKGDKSRYLFTVKVVQAENLVSLDNNPAAMLDAFVVFSDEHGNKLAKTKTIYDTLNPRWEETFDITVIENPLWVMASVRDRQLVGSHDTVGRGYLCLDPRRFGDFLTHDLWLDLDPGGRILVRVSMEGEKDDVMFYFGRAFRSLKRTEAEMARVFVNKMSPVIRNSLSRQTLKSLIKSKPAYDYTKAIGGITSIYRSAVGAINEPAVPLPPEERQQLRKQTEQMSDLEIEAAIAPLFDHFDVNLPVLHSNLSEATKEMVMIKVWKEILGTIENLLLPPLSDVPTDMRPLAQKEVEIVFKWLKFLQNYLYADGNGLSNELLQNKKYRDLMTIPLYYDWATDDLMEQCVREMQQNLRNAQGTMRRAKSVYSQNSLGTIKQRKRDKKKQNQNNNSDIIMRILRMRPNTSDFIRQQIAIQAQMQGESERGPQPRLRPPMSSNGGGRRSWRASRASPVPPVPPLPQ